MLGEADYADAVTGAEAGQLRALGEETFLGDLGRMVGDPEGRRVQVAVRHPVEAAAEVGLDGHFPHVRQVAEVGHRLSVPGPDQGLTPRREQDRELVVAVRRPGGEAAEGSAVLPQLGGTVLRFAKGQ
ncbi:hypothetical protein GCM10029964_076560 [Kibdelosporangium lantanae]